MRPIPDPETVLAQRFLWTFAWVTCFLIVWSNSDEIASFFRWLF